MAEFYEFTFFLMHWSVDLEEMVAVVVVESLLVFQQPTRYYLTEVEVVVESVFQNYLFWDCLLSKDLFLVILEEEAGVGWRWIFHFQVGLQKVEEVEENYLLLSLHFS